MPCIKIAIRRFLQRNLPEAKSSLESMKYSVRTLAYRDHFVVLSGCLSFRLYVCLVVTFYYQCYSSATYILFDISVPLTLK